MKRGRVATFVAGSTAVAVLGLSGWAGAKDGSSIKQLMGENFAGLQTILVALISSNYAVVPAQADAIIEHATELTKAVPDSVKEDRDEFFMYAYNLRANAEDLKSISQQLVEHDKANVSGTMLPPDQLRAAAAAHYGGMVTMCVSCHNRFRQQVVQIK